MRAHPLRALIVCVCALLAGPASAERARVVILPIVVHSAAPDSGYVSRGLADMLSARLEQLGSIDVIRSEDPSQATAQISDAIDAGRERGGDYVLFGSFTQFGDGASLDIRCAPLDRGASPPRSIFIQSGTMGDIIPKLDELADKVAHYVSGRSPVTARAAPAQPDEGASITELRRRLEALEQAVFPPLSNSPPHAAPPQAAEPVGEAAPES